MTFVRNLIAKLYRWYGKRVVWGVFSLVALLAVVGIVITQSSQEETTSAPESAPLVSVARVDAVGGVGMLNLVGTVKAVSEVRLESETSGRITNVNVALGDRVAAGTVIAQIENARERAAVLQAEGVYESALVGGTQAGISFEEAKTSALNTYRNSFTTADDTIRNLTDELFSNPTGQSVGLRIDGKGQALRLNQERVALGNVLESWAANVSAGDTIDPKSALGDAEADLTRIGAFVSDLALLVSDQDANDEFTAEVIASYKTRLSAARSRIDAAIQAISSARNTLLQAEQSAQGGAASSEADARIKQALGALRAAQAALADTVIRTPIAGTVNTLSVRAGDFVSARTPVAIVANNNALEITTFVSESERSRIDIGTEVLLADKYKGTIVNIAPAVDPATKKIEVKIQTEATDIANGDTVRISVATDATLDVNAPIIIPITALKVEADRIVVFTVSSDNTLVAHEVVEGSLVGNSIIIESGLTSDMVIVLDARGLNEGDLVDVAK